jgi:hypothetical protein
LALAVSDGFTALEYRGERDLVAEHRPTQDRLLIAAQAGQESRELRHGVWSLPRAPGR